VSVVVLLYQINENVFNLIDERETNARQMVYISVATN